MEKMSHEDAMKAVGPSGDFPDGKLNDNDEGGLTIAIGVEGDCVKIEFGKQIAWLAMPPDQAIAFAESVLHKALNLHERSS